MTAPLPPDELARLSKLLALLDSDMAGERTAALAKFPRLSVKQRRILDEIARRVLRRATA